MHGNGDRTENDDAARIARRERINEIYRAVWNPLPQPGGGLPFTPDEHIRIARITLPRAWDVGEMLSMRAEPVCEALGDATAAEYVGLLDAEARQ
jgi:hypothetical protein